MLNKFFFFATSNKKIEGSFGAFVEAMARKPEVRAGQEKGRRKSVD